MAAWLAGEGVASAEGVAAAEEAKPYRIVAGKVDRQTYNGYRRYNASCSHCHGPDGAGGSFGPALTGIPAYDAFAAVVLYGRSNGTSVMNGFADDPNIAPYVGDLYAYLRARSDGALARGRPVLDER